MRASAITIRVTHLSPRSATRRRAAIAMMLAFAIVACVPRTAPPPAAPPPTPLPTPAPTPVADWQDWPWTPGTWTYDRDDRGSRALYGPPGADARIVLRCDRAARIIYLSRAGSVAAPFTIRTSTTTRQVPVRATGGALPYVAAQFAATDALLDAMAFSRGRFTIEQPGTTPTVLPPWAEFGRVLEDCRA